MRTLDAIEKDWHRKKPAKFDVGDSVDVHVRIIEGDRERIFPVNSPRVVEVAVEKKGNVRRAKLHYLRDRVGRGTRVEEKLGALEKELAAAPKKAEEPKVEAKAEKKP